MTLTPHSVLRARTLETIADLPGRKAPRAEVLSEMDRRYGELWTPDDLLPQNTRQFESKWRNRVSFLRMRLMNDGLLVYRNDGVWEITDLGLAEVTTGPNTPATVAAELQRRRSLWFSLPASRIVPSAVVNELRVYRGQRGVYVDHERTLATFPPSGAAVSILHTGRDYSDVMSDGGIVYSFPLTSDTTRDDTEIAALKRTHDLDLPLFVVSEHERLRKVQLGYIEGVSFVSRSILVTFVDEPIQVQEHANQGSDTPFEPHSEPSKRVSREVPTRPNQRRFAWQVGEMYGRQCAVCGVAGPGMVDAAHLIPKSQSGTDDPRNGLPLCPNHHRALDRFHWAIEPTALRVVLSRRAGEAAALGLARAGIDHLPAMPHVTALEAAWSEFLASEDGRRNTRRPKRVAQSGEEAEVIE